MGDVLFEKACDEEYDRGYEDGMNDAVKHGRWETEVRTIYGHKIPFFVCSVCGKSAVDEYNYCPHCGAKMRSIDDEVADLPMEAYYNKDWKMDEVEE